MIKEAGLDFDIAFTSVLKRAIKTLYFIQDELDLHWIPVKRHWRLNERMYGALQGLNKAETAQKHGEEQVKVHTKALFTFTDPDSDSDPDSCSWQLELESQFDSMLWKVLHCTVFPFGLHSKSESESVVEFDHNKPNT